jgi:hypothetical protein
MGRNPKGSIEDVTGYTGTISSEHAYIHDGMAYSAVINCGSISSAYNISFTTPPADKGYIHYRPLGITTSANYVGIILTEVETFSSGTAVTIFNRNRLLASLEPAKFKTKMTSLKQGTTCTPSGTAIVNTGMGTSGVPSARSGGNDASASELVLIPNTTYNIALTPAGATTVTVELFWYEESKAY